MFRLRYIGHVNVIFIRKGDVAFSAASPDFALAKIDARPA